MNKVGIVGMGIVGNNMLKIFPEAVCFDKFNERYSSSREVVNNTDICFVCVPTPNDSSGNCQTSEVEEVVKWLEAKVIVIKSTIPIGTTSDLISKTGKNICFSPEFTGYTPNSQPERDFVILGGTKGITRKVAQLYQEKFSGELKIKQTDSKTAELVKYMENSFLACKVVFCNEFYRIAEHFEIDYIELRELFLLDSRINPSHTFVFDEHPYYDSKCFNKDISALYQLCKKNLYSAELIKNIIERNRQFRDEN